MVRPPGFEPRTKAWKALMITRLHYRRVTVPSQGIHINRFGGKIAGVKHSNASLLTEGRVTGGESSGGGLGNQQGCFRLNR